MDLTTNGVVITDAIKFVQTNKEKLMSNKEDGKRKESDESDYHENQSQLEEKKNQVSKRQLIRCFETTVDVMK